MRIDKIKLVISPPQGEPPKKVTRKYAIYKILLAYQLKKGRIQMSYYNAKVREFNLIMKRNN